MKKISLLFVMMLAFAVSVVAQSTLPKPANPKIEEFIDYGVYIVSPDFYFNRGSYIGYSFAKEWDGSVWQLIDLDGNYLDTEKVAFSIFTDNDDIFTFTPEMFDQVEEPTTQFPYNARSYSGDVGMTDIHFNELTNDVEGLAEIGVELERFFNWRIGIQTIYTDGDQESKSDIVYMEIYPQLQEAKNVTSTSFLADWSCEAENTYMINNFIGTDCGYFIYVVNKETKDTVLVQNVEPTHPQSAAVNSIPGATYMVEGLTPGTTYQYFVIVKQNTKKTYKSVVREVTLPYDVYMLGGDDQGWDPSQGAKFEYDAENNVYTLNYTFPAENNYFGFTTKLANDNNGWDDIEPYRFGAIADEGTDFIWYDQYNGQPIAMTWDAYHAIKIAGGEYKLTVNLTDMTLIIEKVVPDHGYEVGDVNHDKAINIADVTALIDHLLGTGTVCEICADVNGDSNINIADVTALIDKLLNIN